MNHFTTVFTNCGDYVREDVMERIENYVRPYYEFLKKAKIYKRKEDKEVYSDKRESLKAEIKNEELMEYLQKEILPIVQKYGKERDQEFEILPTHMDLLVYQKGGYFEDHIDFISNHSNMTQQYTLLIGLENCVTGKTYIWNSFIKDYFGHDESIRRGGLLWFCSDTHHFSEKFEDEENEKTVLSLSLRAIKKKEEPLIEYYTIKSSEGKVFYLRKDKLKNTMLSTLYDIQNGEENEKSILDLNNEELEYIRIYLENERELEKEEMEKIIEKLSFLMLIQPQLKTCALPSSKIKELNEKISKNQKYILFNQFEPWMVEWSEKMKYIPFQIIYHCNDITRQIDMNDNSDNRIKEIESYLKNMRKNFSFQDPDFGERLNSRLDKIYSDVDFLDIENNYIELGVKNKNWVNEEFILLGGDGQYIKGNGELAYIASKMDKKEKKRPIVYKIKQIIHNHQYRYTKRKIKNRFNDYTKYGRGSYYDSDEDKGLDEIEKKIKRKKTIKKLKKDAIKYGKNEESNSEYEYILYNRKRRKSSKETTMHVKKILKNVLKENKIKEEEIDWNKFENQNQNMEDSDFSDEEDNKIQINPGMNYHYLFIKKDDNDSSESENSSISDKKLWMKNESSDSSDFSESDKEEEVSMESDSSTESDKDEEVLMESDKEEEVSMENDKEEEISMESDKEEEVSMESDKEEEVLMENDSLKDDIEFTDDGDKNNIKLNIKNEEDEVDEEEEKKLMKMFENEDSKNSDSSDKSIRSDLKSDDDVIQFGKFEVDEEHIKIYRCHNVHIPLYHESFSNYSFTQEEKKNIINIVKDLSFEEAYDFREQILEKYYEEGCNEGSEEINRYRFKIYYVYYGFIKKDD